MAKVNPVKLKQEAEKLEKAGRPEQAILLYRQIADDNPRDWNVINKVGDLYAKLNRPREAADEYAKVADFYAKDGFLLKAIAIWKKINKLDASALDPYQQLAELYAKQGLMMEAKAQYQIVIDEFIKRGRTRDAGEVLRKMADIDPADLKIRSKLADLYTREGSADKAVGEHIAIAEELNKKGHLAEALQVLEKGLKIDPHSDRLRLELARVHLIQKNYEKAAQYLEEAVQRSPGDPLLLTRLGEAYLGARKIEEAEAIFKRLLEINPGDDEARAQMGRVYLLQERFDDAFRELQPSVERYLARRDGDRAAALLQQVTQRDPHHVPTLNRLAEIYRTFQKETALASTLSQLTEALIAQDQLEQAASVLEELVQREPQNQQHRSKLEFVRSKLAGPSPAAPPSRAPAPAPAAEFEEVDFDVTSPPPVSRPVAPRPLEPVPPPPPAAAPRRRPAVEPTGPLSEEDREFIEEHIAEGRVFRKYGLVDKAIDQFQAVVARFPDNLDARKELREAYRDKGRPAQIAEQCLALADIHRMAGDEAAARAQEEEAERLAPSAPAPARPAAAEPPVVRQAIVADEVPAAASEPAFDFGLDEEEEISLDAEQEDVPIALEMPDEITLPEDTPPAISFAPSQSPILELDEGGDEELTGGFLEEEPSAPSAFTLEEEEITLAPEPPPAATRPDVSFEVELAEEEPLLEEPLLEVPLEEPVEEPLFAEPAREEVAFEEPTLEEPVLEATLLEEESPLADAIAGDAGAGEVEFSLDLGEELALDGGQSGPAVFETAPQAALELEPPALTEAAPPVEAPPAVVEAPAAERPTPAALRRVLDEVDQYMSLGFVDDAREALRDLEARYPDHPAIVAKLDELGLDLEAPAETSPAELADELLGGSSDAEIEVEVVDVEEPSLPSDFGLGAGLDQAARDADAALATDATPSEEDLDLSAELDGLFAAQTAVEPQQDEVSTELGDSGLAEIFKEFKKGVDKQLGQEDYDTRYNLGIAYKEMGLIDEAIAEFQLAAKDEQRLLECSSMLGICFLEKGMPKLAIKWFEKGLRAPGRSDEEYQGLRYDLATAHEAAGDVAAALNLFSELYGQDATFRDVAAKVRELRSQA